MDTIHLPLTRCMRLGAWSLIAGCGALGLAAPTAWPWRFGCAALILATGALLWRHYRRHRPAALQLSRDGSLVCRLGDGEAVVVAGLQMGIVSPRLVSARLLLSDGRRLDLFVPGRSLPPRVHWALRRMLTGFRSAGPGGRTGDDAG